MNFLSSTFEYALTKFRYQKKKKIIEKATMLVRQRNDKNRKLSEDIILIIHKALSFSRIF